MPNYGGRNLFPGIGQGRGTTPPGGSESGGSFSRPTAVPPVKLKIYATGDVDQAIRDYLTQLLLHHHSEYRRPYLSFPYGGLPTSAQNFQFLEDRSKVDQAYDFAQLANSIPHYDAQGRWNFTSNQLADQYTYWLDSFIPPPISITREEQKQLREARKYCEKHFDQYWDYRTNFYNADNEYEAWLHMPESERPPNYEQKLRDAHAQLERARQEWEIKGHRTEYEIQYAVMEDLSRRDPALAKQVLRELMGKPIFSGRGDFYWTSLLPTSAFAPDQPWLRYELEFGTAQADAGGGSPTMALMARRGLDESVFTVEEVALDETRITFEMVRLAIDRGWFADYLLASNAWKWVDSTPPNPLGGYPLSDGEPEPRGHLVMIPREVLFIRNKQFESSGLLRSLSQRKQATGAKPDAWLSFGPFGLRAPRLESAQLGLAAHERSVQSPHSNLADYSLTKSGLEAPHMEYFAFLCELLPTEPNPNWNLWPH